MISSPALKTLLCALLLIGASALPAQAATRKVAPPGNSGINQYVESIPTAHGNQPTNTVHPNGGGTGGPGGGGAAGGSGGFGGGPGGGGSSGALPAATLKALAAHGRDGAAAAALAAGTVPGGATVRGHGPHTGPGGGGASPTGSGSSPLGAVAKAFIGSTGGGGLEVLLPVILAVAALGIAMIALARRRRLT
ncbi:MAG: hypothetical protein M3Z27_01200 [Actinomycetota bacterium]|nr:hypothetical protein [Actinomycetota bacterium]